MINIDVYREYRRKAIPASIALHYASAAPVEPLVWEDTYRNDQIRSVQWVEAGYSLHAKVVVDDSPDTSYLGEFSDSPDSDAIPHDQDNTRTFNWFNPCITLEQHRQALWRTHGRHESYLLARTYIQQDYERARGQGGDWGMYGIRVTAFRAGIALGEASLWGIESDSDEEYFTETARDLATEAITEAEQALCKLCGSH